MTKFQYLSVMSQSDSQGCWVEGADSKDFSWGHKWAGESEMWQELGQAGWELVTVTTTLHPLSQDDLRDYSSEKIRYFKLSE